MKKIFLYLFLTISCFTFAKNSQLPNKAIFKCVCDDITCENGEKVDDAAFFCECELFNHNIYNPKKPEEPSSYVLKPGSYVPDYCSHAGGIKSIGSIIPY